MDGTTASRQAADVQPQLQEIQAHMPATYKAVKEKAGLIGNQAYGHVRAGLRGEPNRFYAMEAGRVMGTPFNLPGVQDELARVILQWGCTFLIMWSPEAQKGQTDGTA